MKPRILSLISLTSLLLIASGCGQLSQARLFQPPSPEKATCQSGVSKPASADELKTLRYQIETYASSAMTGERRYGIVLPPGYEQHPEQCYPVIFLLHGGHGEPKTWFVFGKAIATLKQLYSSDRLPPSIIVTPDGNDLRGSSPYWDPEYVDGQNGNVMTAIGGELVETIKQRYRTLPDHRFWAIGGLSSGGWGAMNIALHYSDRFSVVFSHSGYFTDKSGIENSPVEFVRTLPPQELKQLHVYLDTGNTDSTYLAQNKEFHQVLNEVGVQNQLHTFSGEHTWKYWQTHLVDSLTFVGQQFKQAEVAHN
jgi:enterochelin esterase-like enzyme